MRFTSTESTSRQRDRAEHLGDVLDLTAEAHLNRHGEQARRSHRDGSRVAELDVGCLRAPAVLARPARADLAVDHTGARDRGGGTTRLGEGRTENLLVHVSPGSLDDLLSMLCHRSSLVA
jgi:hypothetical protein